MIIDNLKKTVEIKNSQFVNRQWELAVLRDEKKIAANSSLSFSSWVTLFSGSNFSSIMNSSQKLLSSASSITILNFEINPDFDWAIHAALLTL